MSPEDDEIYKSCPECGKLIKWEAVICPYCGVQVKELKVDVSYNPTFAVNVNPVKSKTVAVVLAIFFGYWSWLYTYKINKGKFWFFLIADIVRTIYMFRLIITQSNIDIYNFSQIISSDFYVAILFSSILTVISWLWALISNSTKPNLFYINYPNG
jgi:hypothetical protein